MALPELERGIAALRSGDAAAFATLVDARRGDAFTAYRRELVVRILEEVDWSDDRHLRALLPSAASLFAAPDLPGDVGRRLVAAMVPSGDATAEVRRAVEHGWAQLRAQAGQDEWLRTGMGRIARASLLAGGHDAAMALYDVLTSASKRDLAALDDALSARTGH